MVASFSNAIKNNIVLKCMAIILGYSLWLFISSLHRTTVWFEVPVTFYNQHDHLIINAPETIQVQLSGYRSDLYAIDVDILAIHLDAQQLQQGQNPVTINAHNLFLPEAISVVNYTPSNSSIECITA